MSLPQKPLSNFDIIKYVSKLKIAYFRGVYMRDNMPTTGPRENESAIINLDGLSGAGTHWVAYKKYGSVTHYFDSFGNLPPPIELVMYLYRGTTPTRKILYNYEREQLFDSVVCGHLCLKFLSEKH